MFMGQIKMQTAFSAVIPIFINRMKKNFHLTLNGGYQTRDFFILMTF